MISMSVAMALWYYTLLFKTKNLGSSLGICKLFLHFFLLPNIQPLIHDKHKIKYLLSIKT
jgi:hypothetical protein